MNETEAVIRGVCDAASALITEKDVGKASAALLAAIDKAMSHAYAEGRKEQADDERAAYSGRFPCPSGSSFL